MSSAVTGAAALLELLPATEPERKAVERFHKAGGLAELAAMAAVEAEISRVSRVGRPLRSGAPGALWRGAMLCGALSLVLSLVPSPRRSVRVTSSLLVTAASIGIRFAVFMLGKASARDPRATFHHQRAGHGAAELTGPRTAEEDRAASRVRDRREAVRSGSRDAAEARGVD
jgi:hypothetical protein